MACSASRPGCVDLHIHSSFSDGSLTPARIMEDAHRQGLFAVSITDHDTVEGIIQLPEEKLPDLPHFLSGVEISAQIPAPFSQDGTLHLLGYGIDCNNKPLQRALAACQEARRQRNPQIIERLAALGLPISRQEVEALSGSGQTGRPHMAQVLVNNKGVASMEEAFERYLGKGRPAYVDKFRFPADQAIELIRQAGGIAVLAHPFSLNLPPDLLERLVIRFVEMGLGGIEAIYPAHDSLQTQSFADLAGKLGLLVTGGTDFHGASKPHIRIGVGKGDFFVPASIYENLLRSLEKIKGQKR
ncbi:MAG: PHP domain-containing protein [Desulfatibacillaceae bacterium]|nr:PHP domain-containing protein [Desulfatibacillaceae bacterium]